MEKTVNAPEMLSFDADDVRALVQETNGEKRADATRRICTKIRHGRLSEREREFARKLLVIMADDALALVRRALAVTLRNSHELPRDIAVKLASDIENIAVPVLECSPVFTDSDLIDILKSKAAAKATAVAKRPTVSGNVVRAIIRYGDSQAVANVAANDGAVIDIETANHILDQFHDDDLIKEAFIARNDLPIPVMEKLITLISSEAARLLNRRHDIPLALAFDLSSRARERATLDLTDFDVPDRELRLLCNRLHEEGRLGASFVVRAAGMGRFRFVVMALSVMANVKPEKAAIMVHDTGPFGLHALCQRADIAGISCKVIKAASVIYRDLEASGIEYDRAYFQTLMAERTLTLPYDLPEDDEKWLLEKLDAMDQATTHRA